MITIIRTQSATQTVQKLEDMKKADLNKKAPAKRWLEMLSQTNFARTGAAGE